MGEAERRSVGSIQLRERLGSNGLYLADQPGLGRRVVVRKLRRDLLANSSLVASLEREGRLGASVLHPNVVAVFDFFSLHGDQYLVMEHVDGLSLRAHSFRHDASHPSSRRSFWGRSHSVRLPSTTGASCTRISVQRMCS